MRAVSTVVDATVFLLVLGVAVATVVGVPMVSGDEGTATDPTDLADPTNHADATDHADAVAEFLATGIERVNYSLASAARTLPGDPPIEITDGPPFRRSAHGTLASLLADAATGSITVDSEPISRDGRAYERAVVDATERRIFARNYSVSVRAVWEPYPDAPIRGTVNAGRSPPATVDVTAATVVVDAPMPSSKSEALAAARQDGYEGVAIVISRSVVAGLFPPEETVLALRGDYPVAALTANRYHRTAIAVGHEGGASNGHTDVAAENRKLAASLADELEKDLGDRYGSAAAAARNVSTGTVTVTVRTWSR